MDNLKKYCLRLGDNSLVLGHRLAEYCSRGPYLEEDLAISNVALDHIGLAELLLGYVASVTDDGKTADDYAYERLEVQYRNCQLVEQPNTDFAYIMARQFFIDVFNYFVYSELTKSKDETLSNIAAKTIKEVTYHLKRSSEWVIRLGDGTDESHRRIQLAIGGLWMFTHELFDMPDSFTALKKDGIVPDMSEIKKSWDQQIDEVLKMATLIRPEDKYKVTGSINGIHSEYFGHMLTDMQYLHKAHPDANW